MDYKMLRSADVDLILECLELGGGVSFILTSDHLVPSEVLDLVKIDGIHAVSKPLEVLSLIELVRLILSRDIAV